MNIKGTDIVKRLREHIVSIPNLEEAAAEIDRLRADNKMLTAALLAKDGKNFDDACKEIDRLRAENAAQDKRILEWGDKYADLSNETDRLRAENAELRGWLEASVKEIDNPLITMHMSAILAKTAKEGE